MLTARGWWLLIVTMPLTVVGFLIPDGYPLAAMCCAIVLWFTWEWLQFTRARLTMERLRVRRRLLSGGRPVPMLWANRPATVEIEVSLPHGYLLPYLIIEDRVPFGILPEDGDHRAIVRLTDDEPATLRYRLPGSQPGVLRFEGVRLDIADLQGFFHTHTVLRDPVEIPVLPPLVNAEGHPRTEKRTNLLLPPGQHRLRTPGSGSELLDLRDYRPGDPPKMIAWKPSARRDRLITKEFEGEVPLRCTMFLDTSAAVRLGPPGRNALARLVAVAASVAQTTTAHRDLIGLTTFDETGVEVTKPDRSSRHLIALMAKLAHASRLRPAGADADVPTLTQLGLKLADDVYPDLIRSEVNSLPWKMYWQPMLDKRWGWFILALMLSPLLIIAAILMSVPGVAATIANIAGAIAWEKGVVLPVFLGVVILPAIVGGLTWLLHGLSGLVPPKLRRIGRRKRLSSLISHHAGLGPRGTALLCEDDAAFARYVQQFLGDHLAPYPVRLFDHSGRYQFRDAAKAEVLSRALTRSVGRARDNELYVIFADLFELGRDIEPVRKAVRLALARHHEVLIVCPWLAGMPPPDEPVEHDGTGPWLPSRLDEVHADVIVERYHTAYAEVKAAFGRIGVPVVRANKGDPVRLILERLERLRGVPSRR